jgi:hypothetical protein
MVRAQNIINAAFSLGGIDVLTEDAVAASQSSNAATRRKGLTQLGAAMQIQSTLYTLDSIVTAAPGARRLTGRRAPRHLTAGFNIASAFSNAVAAKAVAADATLQAATGTVFCIDNADHPTCVTGAAANVDLGSSADILMVVTAVVSDSGKTVDTSKLTAVAAAIETGNTATATMITTAKNAAAPTATLASDLANTQVAMQQTFAVQAAQLVAGTVDVAEFNTATGAAALTAATTAAAVTITADQAAEMDACTLTVNGVAGRCPWDYHEVTAAAATCANGGITSASCACDSGYAGGGAWSSGATYPACVQATCENGLISRGHELRVRQRLRRRRRLGFGLDVPGVRAGNV